MFGASRLGICGIFINDEYQWVNVLMLDHMAYNGTKAFHKYMCLKLRVSQLR